MNKCAAFVAFVALSAGVGSFGCGGEATTPLGPVAAGGSGAASVGSAGKSGESTGGSSASRGEAGGAGAESGSPGAGTDGVAGSFTMGGSPSAGSSGVGGSSGSSAGDGGTGGDCFKVMCDLILAPKCKDANTLTTYSSPTFAEAPCGASCISIPTDVPCGPNKQCAQSTPMGAACVDPVATCTQDQASYQKSRNLLLASTSSCATSTDCDLLFDNNLCGVDCGTPINVSMKAKTLAALTELANNKCGTCPPIVPPPCAQSHAICVHGECSRAF